MKAKFIYVVMVEEFYDDKGFERTLPMDVTKMSVCYDYADARKLAIETHMNDGFSTWTQGDYETNMAKVIKHKQECNCGARRYEWTYQGVKRAKVVSITKKFAI